MEILPSARRHGVADEDIVHTFEHALAWIELDDDPPRYLLAGPSQTGNLLELVVINTDVGEFTIHAMVLRPSTEEALFGDERP